jgi:plastocyanin
MMTELTKATRWAAILAAVLAATLAGCGKKSGSTKKKPAGDGTTDTGGDLKPAPIGAHKITGTVTFAGPAPSVSSVGVTSDVSACGSSQPDPAGPVVKDGKLAGVVVHLEGTVKGTDPRKHAVTVNQKGCRYIPHTQSATVGDELDIPNSDAVTHNVHGYAGDTGLFNEPTMAGGKTTQSLSDPGPVHLKCDIHPWMSGWIQVFDHPYHGTSDESGAFELPAPPPGDYDLVAWHEKLGEKKLKVKVTADGDVKVDVAY